MGRYKEMATKLSYRLWPENEWFEDNVEVNGTFFPRLSKFAKLDFSVPLASLVVRWPKLSRKQKITFASAFGYRPKLVSGDREILDFLMENGTVETSTMIALLVAHDYPDANRALEFLLPLARQDTPRVAHGIRYSKANIYQALAVLGRSECVAELQRALVRHREDVNANPSLHWWKMWRDRFAYLDYLTCSAALFKLTGEEDYRANLRQMLEHRDTPVGRMVRAVAMSTGITV